ncbi:MAG: DUF3179 domain-containing protein [Chloroflexota bacterium]
MQNHFFSRGSNLVASIAVGCMLLFLIVACQLQPLAPLDSMMEAGESNPNIFSEIFPGQPIPDEIAQQLMGDLSDGSEAERNAAIEAILTAQDERFIPVLIELQRFAQIGIAPGEFMRAETLERLSGESFGGDWASWIEWYGGTDLTPPPGFTSWKGRVLSKIDPGFGEFLQDSFGSTIRAEEIQWGGVRVDGIPALDYSRMVEPGDAPYLVPEEPVFGLAINGDARAYPLRILDWHEMANDIVGDVPVSIAYCTLCGAAIAFDGRASDGTIYDFGSSGFLFRSNKLMYDRQTRTLWNQMSGEPVLGPLVGQDVKLDILPIVLTTWESWLEQHPETQVLDLDTGFNRPYDVGSAYGDYFSSNETMFPVWQRSDLLETKDRIYAMQIDGVPVAYPIKTLDEEQVVNHTVGDTNVVVVAQRGAVNVDGLSRRAGPVTYSAGGEARAYNRGEHEFFPGADPDSVVDANGQIWTVTEDALISPDGLRVERLGGHLAYWFGWFTFFPETLVYGETG